MLYYNIYSLLHDWRKFPVSDRKLALIISHGKISDDCIIYWQGHIAVSYTHLDVYKRQHLFITILLNMANKKAGKKKKIGVYRCTETGATTVSYTHLDVYKRQVEGQHFVFYNFFSEKWHKKPN